LQSREGGYRDGQRLQHPKHAAHQVQVKIWLKWVGIYKSFGGLHALKDVNLYVRYHEVIGLVGDNAAASPL